MPPSLFASGLAHLDLVAWVVPERGLDRPGGLAYLVPESMHDLRSGDRVLVPLGRGDHLAAAWVIDRAAGDDAARQLAHDQIDPARLKLVASWAGRSAGSQADSVTRLPESLLSLARWMSHYYCCPIGMVFQAIVPAAVKRQTGAAVRRRLDRLDLDSDQLATAIETLSPGAKGAWDGLARLETTVFPIDARELARRLRLKTAAPVNRLVRAGLLREVESFVVRPRTTLPEQSTRADPARTLDLTADQRRAIEAVSRQLGSFSPFLLFGVTGSGKTEVYLNIIERVMERGETAIVLVPEIMLTPQTTDRFQARFCPRGIEPAVLHSGLTSAQRHAQWRRVADASARIVIGARSAIFAPFDAQRGSPLGVIIVDEEHDSSYKQDQLPRYHGRDVALKRAQLENCPVVLGSATPSLESWHNALPSSSGGTGRFTLLELPKRVAGGVLPPVRIVDLAKERQERHTDKHRLHALGPQLEAALAKTLDHPEGEGGGGQAILLLNRRGYASYICCVDASCGWFMACRDCDVTVVYHRSKETRRGFVRCHHCQAEHKLPESCPMCAKRINTFGFGTQRLEEELERKFPTLRSGETLLRIDADTMRHARDYYDALDRFSRGEVRLLMGTQMIAKGLDFPGVELIGVINADTALHLPDFRSTERTFQLVAQVAGRAGRSAASGKVARVIVQTLNPHEPAIELASHHDFRSFATRELECRRAVGLPPTGRMARIVCRDRNPDKAEARAYEIARALRDLGGDSLRCKGPMPCAISRVAGHHRWSIELLSGSPGPIQTVLAALRSAGLVKSDAHTAVDVDPVALL